VCPALNSRTNWTHRVPHPVLIGHAAPRAELPASSRVRSVAVNFSQSGRQLFTKWLHICVWWGL